MNDYTLYIRAAYALFAAAFLWMGWDTWRGRAR
jgi:hypothetical protein